jgi:hypothetical protein
MITSTRIARISPAFFFEDVSKLVEEKLGGLVKMWGAPFFDVKVCVDWGMDS